MGIESEMYGDDILEHQGFYRGVVEDVDDPEKAGRVKIRVLGIHSDNKGYVETKHLPWAIPATSLGLSGGGARNIGSFGVPVIGSHVYLFFEHGDHNYPVYFAGAPAIEDTSNYQEKDGKYDSENSEYEYDETYRYDDNTNYSEKREFYETKQDEKIENPVQDWCPQTRKNTFGEGGSAQIPPPIKTNEDAQPIFPEDYFVEDVRIAFDGAANHDSLYYNGIGRIKPSNILSEIEKKQELDLWSERKWGWNDDDKDHQHDYDGGVEWKPEYPMCNTERNAQGEIYDTDILKERRTYIHPSKYFVELIQLDSSRKKDDFYNEASIKKIYERQRGISNAPASESRPVEVQIVGDANDATPIKSDDNEIKKRVENEITYDDIDGEERQQELQRFEERKHNPGREKTVVEDFVYRFFMNKVNETFQVDRNTRFYTGNDNMEIEHGDRNYRLHRGSHNQHIDEGNYNRIVNRGWEHLHIDEGHHFIEICGPYSVQSNLGSTSNVVLGDYAPYNAFETSGTHEDDGNPEYCDNQHSSSSDDRDNHPSGEEYKSSGLGCDAKFQAWEFEGENVCGNQFFLFHKGSQIFRFVEGHQHFHIIEGHQKFHIETGHQTFHIESGDQRWQLDSGDMERYANGHRYSIYTDSCVEDTGTHWRILAADWIALKAPEITLDGNVRITGDVEIDGNVKCGVIDSPGSPSMVVPFSAKTKAVDPAGPSTPSGSASVPSHSATNPLSPGSCPS